MSLMNF